MIFLSRLRASCCWLGLPGSAVRWHPALGAAFIAAAGWGLSEYFTRVRRMALPSIIFLLAFVGDIFAAVSTTLLGTTGYHGGNVLAAIWLTVAGAVAAGAAYFHWRRFLVPIMVAARAAAVATTAFAIVLAVVLDVSVIQFPLMAVSGVAIFTLAMW